MFVEDVIIDRIRKSAVFILFFAALVSLSGCGSKSISLSNDELGILKEIGFDTEIAKQAKSYLLSSFYQFETSDPGSIVKDGKQQKTGTKKQNGISWKVGSEKTNPAIHALRDDLKKKDYLIFVSEQGDGGSPSEITIIKSADQFDILRIQKTDGINYNHDNEDVIKRLQEWNDQYGIEIIGAGYDWVEISIVNTPKDVKEFAKEVYAFCPDSVNQGVGTIEALESAIKDKSRLFLWWD
jgi:hypothetical protein